MKALNAIHYPVFGGPHNEILRSGALLGRYGWEQLTLLPDEPGSGVERLRAAGLEVAQLHLHRLRAKGDPRLHLGLACKFVPEIQQIRRLIRELEVDLVRVMGLINPHAGIAARLEGKPVVWQIVDTRSPPALRRATTAVARHLADALLFDGQRVADLHGAHRFQQPWFTYFPPVDTRLFRPDPERASRTRQTLGVPADARVVGSVSNLNPQKGPEYLIRAAGRILAEIDNVWLLVVGASYPSHRALLRRLEAEMVRSHLPRERVIFTGGVSEPQHYYPAMDVKLVTSPPRSEGTTTTVPEALSCGVPVVATDVGAVSEVIDEGQTGFVVPALDPQALAAATLHLLRDEGRRRAMSELARRAAVERFDVNSYVHTVAQGFEAALSHHTERSVREPVGSMRSRSVRTPSDAAESASASRDGQGSRK
jgi:glycosyltransferase involved in cell wall biosynthesis